MRVVFIALLTVVIFTGCTAKNNPNGSYERANAASEKAHNKLDRE